MSYAELAALERAKLFYTLRRHRNRALGPRADLMGEPAWDMLLDLFIARHEGRLVGTCSAAIGACTSTTTGLRCVSLLDREGLVTRVADPQDRRRSFVAISGEADALMRRVLAGMAPAMER